MARQPLTVEQILTWADAYRSRTGHWPTTLSGAIPESGEDNETWHTVNEALQEGKRGLPSGSTLARLLAQKRGTQNRAPIRLLSEDMIAAWARAHHHRTGRWPDRNSGVIPESPGDTWKKVNHAL